MYCSMMELNLLTIMARTTVGFLTDNIHKWVVTGGFLKIRRHTLQVVCGRFGTLWGSFKDLSWSGRRMAIQNFHLSWSRRRMAIQNKSHFRVWVIYLWASEMYFLIMMALNSYGDHQHSDQHSDWQQLPTWVDNHGFLEDEDSELETCSCLWVI